MDSPGLDVVAPWLPQSLKTGLVVCLTCAKQLYGTVESRTNIRDLNFTVSSLCCSGCVAGRALEGRVTGAAHSEIKGRRAPPCAPTRPPRHSLDPRVLTSPAAEELCVLPLTVQTGAPAWAGPRLRPDPLAAPLRRPHSPRVYCRTSCLAGELGAGLSAGVTPPRDAEPRGEQTPRPLHPLLAPPLRAAVVPTGLRRGLPGAHSAGIPSLESRLPGSTCQEEAENNSTSSWRGVGGASRFRWEVLPLTLDERTQWSLGPLCSGMKCQHAAASEGPQTPPESLLRLLPTVIR